MDVGGTLEASGTSENGGMATAVIKANAAVICATGLPVAFSRWNSSVCRPGRPISVRDFASPLRSQVSPMASTITSAQNLANLEGDLPKAEVGTGRLVAHLEQCAEVAFRQLPAGQAGGEVLALTADDPVAVAVPVCRRVQPADRVGTPAALG